jgi:hypothetical protein
MAYDKEFIEAEFTSKAFRNASRETLLKVQEDLRMLRQIDEALTIAEEESGYEYKIDEIGITRIK